MRILRWIGTRLLAAGLGLSLSLLSITAIVSATVLNTGFLKTAIENSGFYDNFISSSLKLAAEGLDEKEADMAQLISDMAPTVEQVITPELLQTNFELVIDSAGDWLDGKTEKPQFVIDTASLKSDLDIALATYLEQRINALPFCSDYYNLSSDQVVTTGCRPPVEISQNEFLTAASEFTKEIPMLNEPELNANDAFKDVSEDVWQTTPNAYKWARLAPYLFALLSVIFAAAIIFVSHDRIKAIRRIGHIILGNAVILIVAGAVITIFFGNNDIDFISSDSAAQATFIKEIVIPGIQALFSTFGTWLLYFGVGYALLSVICYVVAHWLLHKKKGSSKPGEHPDHKPVPLNEAEKTPEDKEEPKTPTTNKEPADKLEAKTPPANK